MTKTLEVMTESVDASRSLRSDPLVSVIIPAFNSAAYLGEALDSLRAQTLRDLEIIVIDDGSSDESLAVAHGARRAILASASSRTRSPPDARRARATQGMRVARGQYIALLDADDVPTRVESSRGRHEEHGDPDSCSPTCSGATPESGELAPQEAARRSRSSTTAAVPIEKG